MTEAESNPQTVPEEGVPASASPTLQKKKDSGREFVEAIVVALVLALFIRTFIVQAFKIPSGSMIPTLLVGDHILVNKFIYGIGIPFTDDKLIEFGTPKRGEVIVFKFPKDPSKDFIKRVIGLPGDTVAIKNGVIQINGTPVPMISKGSYDYQEASEGELLKNTLHEEVLGDNPHPVIMASTGFFGPREFDPVTVPDGQLFMMGDNRDRSNDSRYWGFVDISAVEGRAIAIYWSWDSDETTVRWDRLGDLIH